MLASLACGVRSIVGLAVAGLSGMLATSTLLAVFFSLRREESPSLRNLLSAVTFAFLRRRRSWAGFVIHIGFGCMAVGIAGSSLGSRETDVSMTRGQSIEFVGRTIRYAELRQADLRQKVVVAAQLEVTEANGTCYTVQPAQVLYRPQNQWGTKVAIHSTFARDFYVIMHGGSEAAKIHLTLIDHPLMRWLWIGGWIGLVGVAIAMTPERRKAEKGSAPGYNVVPRPHLADLNVRAEHD